jgi:hypothetical protein
MQSHAADIFVCCVFRSQKSNKSNRYYDFEIMLPLQTDLGQPRVTNNRTANISFVMVRKLVGSQFCWGKTLKARKITETFSDEKRKISLHQKHSEMLRERAAGRGEEIRR